MSRALYTLLWYLGAPFIALRLLWRARQQPGYLSQPAERLGYYRQEVEAPIIWVHAVSVGETRAAQPLVRALLTHYPTHRILLTQMTPTGRETARSLYRDDGRVQLAWLPYDTPGCTERFFAHFRPDLGVLMETEVWPNLLLEARKRGVPMLLANARLSERSARGYGRAGGLARAAFGALAAVGAQTHEDADRLAALGAPKPAVTGNIKFEISAPAAQLALAAEFRGWIGERPVVLLASSREGEEESFLDAWKQRAPEDALLVIVPRHPQRFESVVELISQRGLSLARRTDNRAVPASTRVWLGDSMGEMFAYFAAADVAIIGGSWAPLGGQNLIEAAAVGVPTLIGPHTFNFAQASEHAVTAGAALRCQDASQAVTAALTLLADTRRRAAMSSAAREFAEAHRGALGKTLELIDLLMTGATPEDQVGSARA
ncbi:lipid IV(A) 3-deoxy-D-manno-octulosonic acid transferase [Niveibacterium sp. SC-1]|uniref:lipid IV(A) 3-deoxy-D-manno-octulosonic acid transferase n=1 Tax=Niveibacterium sp. SC-1 TaxID=3135646 RepID=UPI00311EE5D6